MHRAFNSGRRAQLLVIVYQKDHPNDSKATRAPRGSRSAPGLLFGWSFRRLRFALRPHSRLFPQLRLTRSLSTVDIVFLNLIDIQMRLHENDPCLCPLGHRIVFGNRNHTRELLPSLLGDDS